VVLTTPLDQVRVEHESIGLAGVISGGKGVSRVVVTLNGVEVTRQDERTPLPALPVSLPVRLREGSNALVVTATEADGKVYQEVRTVLYEKRIPLTVVIRYPEDKARVTDEASVIAAMVTSSKGVAKVTVTVNGTEVHQQTERAPQKSLVVTAPVTFREGSTGRSSKRSVRYSSISPRLPLPSHLHRRLRRLGIAGRSWWAWAITRARRSRDCATRFPTRKPSIKSLWAPPDSRKNMSSS
jgi:hypothetical protein